MGEMARARVLRLDDMDEDMRRKRRLAALLDLPSSLVGDEGSMLRVGEAPPRLDLRLPIDGERPRRGLLFA